MMSENSENEYWIFKFWVCPDYFKEIKNRILDKKLYIGVYVSGFPSVLLHILYIFTTLIVRQKVKSLLVYLVWGSYIVWYHFIIIAYFGRFITVHMHDLCNSSVTFPVATFSFSPVLLFFDLGAEHRTTFCAD
jgi:hypothetical protein